MNGKPASNFALVNRCLGWGDPVDALWFIAMEEGEPYCENEDEFAEEMKKLRDAETAHRAAAARRQDFFWKQPDEPKAGQCERAESFVASKLIRNRKVEEQEFLKKYLWRPQSQTFHANLYPLPWVRGGNDKKRNDRWPKHYEHRFGVDGFTDRYKAFVAESRFRWLRDLIETAKPRGIVCFGKEEWETENGGFCRLFEGATAEQSDISNRIRRLRYGAIPVVLAYHFSNGWFLGRSAAAKVTSACATVKALDGVTLDL